MNRGIVRAAALTVVGFAVFAGDAAANTFQVTKTGDSNPNGCSQGGCTLREATIAANNKNGADTILLDGGQTYKMSIPGSAENLSATGDFDLTDKTTVRAAGGGMATIDGNKIDGIFQAYAKARFEQLELTRADFNSIEVIGGADVTVERSAISKGNIGVRVNDGDATIRHTTIDDTSSNAVYQQGPGDVKVADSELTDIGSTAISEYDEGNVSVEGTTVKDIASNFVYESAGGNVRVAKSNVSTVNSTGISEYDDGNVTITGSKLDDFSSNFVYESSGGNIRVTGSDLRKSGSTAFSEYDVGNVILKKVDVKNSSSNMIYESSDGNVKVSRSQLLDAGSTIISEYDLGSVNLSRSKLDKGKSTGIYESDIGDVKLSSSKLSRVKSSGIQEYDLGGLTLKRSEISGAKNDGVFMTDGEAHVNQSTVAGNKGSGLVFGASVDATVENSTIARNGNSSVEGGGIRSAGVLFVENSTIYGNKANAGGGVAITTGTAELNAVTITQNKAGLQGGGIYSSPAGTVIGNSIVADNKAPTGPDCYASVTFTSEGHNLISDDEVCGGLGSGSDTVKGSAKTEGLKNNGGPTKTAAISASSPAVGKAGNSSPSKDQRGHKRDSQPDIGAFER